ncbi:hypothetical protein NDU88_007188 [Pleurodeles waltl]|uniref:Pseudouridylate synthase 1 homolog n=1 Tax=Pleurodeles waltl TaxID=8319 RepID=A0AAV7SRL2_PLEWA|nr:hypothetical protein NDU88_007188 [Pleurodeles waltl]
MKAIRLLNIWSCKRWVRGQQNSAQTFSPFSDGVQSRAVSSRSAEDVLKEDVPDREEQHAEGSEIKEVRQPKRKYALLMAYSGREYYGMQINPGVPTVELVLISAFINAQCVPKDCTTTVRTWLNLQRCARTDKGVSALGQLVSVRLLKSEDLMEKINAHLPADIRVLGVKQVTKGFNAKSMCEARTYSYTLPTFALAHGTEPDSSFRLPREDFHRFHHILTFYQGTHRYHNFTSHKTADDPSVFRHMFKATLQEPYLDMGHEFTTIEITGQSFLLHQIRKMVGLALAVSRGVVPEDFLPASVAAENRLKIRTAPGLGLVLEQTYFKWYNKRFGGDGLHSPLTWEDAAPATETFRKDHILPAIVQGELEDLSMTRWLRTLSEPSQDE